MFISVGYGRNQQGRMLMRFPTLGSDGGERRLNVLITRAKRSAGLAFLSIWPSLTLRGRVATSLELNVTVPHTTRRDRPETVTALDKRF
jgi:hypothetical protein